MDRGKTLFSTLLALYTAISMTACTTTANKETKVSKITPSQVITETFTPTLEEITATPTLTETPTITPTDTPIPTNTLTPTPTEHPYNEECRYNLRLIEQIYPNTSAVKRNSEFTETWLVENTGNCDIWGSEFAYISGSELERITTHIPYIKAGEEAQISINLRAPSEPGIYKSKWAPVYIKEDSEMVIIGDELSTEIIVDGILEQEKFIAIDLSEQKLYAYDEGELKHTYIVSTGKAITPTPTGQYKIELKKPSQTMGRDDSLPNVQWVMYFKLNSIAGYAIHGAYWHNNFGTPVSHGCVNVRTTQAEVLYEMYDYDDPVYIVNSISDLSVDSSQTSELPGK